MIVLNMIVRNEAHVIKRCLDSIAPFIDAAVIADTGSTDDTVPMIKSILQWIPTTVLHHKWKNFGHNRTKALEAARRIHNSFDYILLIDADEELKTSPPFDMPRGALGPMWVWHHTQHGRYARPILLDLQRTWRFEGVVHEFATCGHDVNMLMLNGCYVQDHFDSHRNRDGMRKKLLQDAALLLEEERTPRNVFYLAESYRGACELHTAAKWYACRVAMANGCDQERWWAAYMLAHMKKQLKAPPAAVEAAFLRAIELRPSRAETYIAYARFLWEQDRAEDAKAAYAQGRKLPMTTDTLNVIPECYRTGSAQI